MKRIALVALVAAIMGCQQDTTAPSSRADLRPVSVFSIGTTSDCTFTGDPVMTLTADCTTDGTLYVEDGKTLDGANHTITAVDPAGGHFLGAVVMNASGAMDVTIQNVRITANSALAEVCDGGNNRLRGILLDGASGSIISTTVTGVRQGFASGCQEGNAIEVRNHPETPGGPNLNVTIAGNIVSAYQKNGITANGAVAAMITDNVVFGAGPIDYTAQNGIQVGYGATATVQRNYVSGNNYTPASYVACGLLIWEASGVRSSKNNIFDNERDQCNFGKGGGRFNPTS